MVNVGDSVSICDEKRVDHVALVTAIHGWTTEEQRQAHYDAQLEAGKTSLESGQIDQERFDQWTAAIEAGRAMPFAPSCINVVYVSKDAAKHDPYGNQLERLSSLQHESAVQNMTVPGRFYRT
jgi:hypothetical protein